jgi:hypothetical protein
MIVLTFLTSNLFLLPDLSEPATTSSSTSMAAAIFNLYLRGNEAESQFRIRVVRPLVAVGAFGNDDRQTHRYKIEGLLFHTYG